LKTAYYTFEQCSKILLIMLKFMLPNSRLCLRTNCFIGASLSEPHIDELAEFKFVCL